MRTLPRRYIDTLCYGLASEGKEYRHKCLRGGERTLEAFYERLQPFAVPFIV